ncbi:hypothetical protein FEE96_16425 [Parasedimentitalea maritima]|uniref:Replication protein n=1 Tax=Parasedimentitalea maritima TaxID=2578117 RepID=A0ABY2UXV0_9RHOB|nr:hypothetical protein [Zongyanglinia marina]TLP60441.1 hypothetical protein FEE96_16425 [Zongyanglinia marina]
MSQIYVGDSCEQGRTVRKSSPSSDKEAISISGPEIIEGGVNLGKVGLEAEYKGGFKFCAGSLKHREKTQIVMDMGERVGISLKRSVTKKSAQFLLGLPEGEYLGIVYDAPAHNKHLPSTAIVDCNQTAANILYYLEYGMEHSSQLATFTFPPLTSRVSVENLRECIKLAFERYNTVKKRLSESGLGEFLYCQLEMTYNEDDGSFYPHFHVFLEVGKYDANRLQVLATLASSMPWVGGNAGILLKQVKPADAMRFVKYGTKPGEAAVSIAQAGHEEVFKAYYEATKGVRLTRTEKSLKACLAQLKTENRRAKIMPCKETGEEHVVLVEKRRRDPEGEPENVEGLDPLPEVGKHEPVSSGTTNIFCGSSSASPSPSGRLMAFGLVQNFDEENLHEVFAVEGKRSFYQANKAAWAAWEKNTGEPFDLKKFLIPLAPDILAAIRRPEFKSYTVIASSNILRILNILYFESEG